jgi:predicted RNA-binding Zn-ribbon protein involved in translation (DUF1610 family)
MHLSRLHPLSSEGLLYRLLWICALAVIVFSVVGMIFLTGWVPSPSLSATPSVAPRGDVTPSAPSTNTTLETGSEVAKAVSVFQCTECGVIDSIRDIESRKEASSISPTPDASAPGR